MSKRSGLTRDRIAEIALKLADKEGFDAVSMRRVAEALGVGTMSLYYYVKTKDELLALMDDALLGEALLTELPKDWRDAMIAIATRTHEVFVRHPWAIVSMLKAPPGRNAMKHVEQCLQALEPSGLDDRQKITLLANLDDFVFGYALRESSVAPVDMKFAKEQLATGEFPLLGKTFRKGRIEPARDRFVESLRALLDSSAAKKKRKRR